MRKNKQIFISKLLLLKMIAVSLLYISCALPDDEFDPSVNVTDDVIIANEIETTVKALGVIYREVEEISAKMKMGQALGVEISEDGNGWSYVFDTSLLSGKIIVKYSESDENEQNIQNVDCTNLQVHYYGDTWSRLFGSFTIENAVENQTSIKNDIKAVDFGYNNNLRMLPGHTMNSDYVIEYNFAQTNGFSKLVYLGTGEGYSQHLGDYKKSIAKNLEINTVSLNIVKGKMIIIVNKLGEKYPVEVEYSETGRTVKYRGREQITNYSN